MELTGDDIEKFHLLLNRIDKLSPNIGVVKNDKDFKRYMKKVIRKMPYTSIYADKERKKYTILIDDIEYSYIQVQTDKDLIERKFKKFIK